MRREDIKMILKKDFKKDESAVVGIVTAILIIGLVVTVFAIIQTVYVPQWMEEFEMEHMNEVAGQFAELKYATDLQLFSQSASNQSITTPFTLGSDKIPFFLSERSYGSLEIVDSVCNVTIDGDSVVTFDVNGIEYRSRNNHYVDQTFRYETGAVIISQAQGSFLSTMPFFSISASETKINMTLTVVNVTGIGGKTTASGYSLVSIATKFLATNNTVETVENVTEIMIETEYPTAWKSYFNQTLQTEGLAYDDDYSLSYSIENEWIKIEFYPEETNNQIMVSSKQLSAQISPGWIQ
jgi:hypothetical protein